MYALASVKGENTSALNDIQIYLYYNLKYFLYFDFTAPVRRPNHSWEEADQKTSKAT